ncbi:MAG TPA: hypothetical protein VGM51_06865, partial [Armatimonadota bacterium]
MMDSAGAPIATSFSIVGNKRFAAPGCDDDEAANSLRPRIMVDASEDEKREIRHTQGQRIEPLDKNRVGGVVTGPASHTTRHAGPHRAVHSDLSAWYLSARDENPIWMSLA